MEAAIIGAVLKVTIPKLLSVIGEKKRQLKSLEASVESIRTELVYIQAAIEGYRGSGKDTSDVWRARYEELRDFVYDIEDCIDRFLHQVMSHSQGSEEGFFRRVAQDAKTMKPRMDFAKKIRDLEKKSSKIHNRFKRYIKERSDEGASSSPKGKPTPREEDVHSAADRRVGMAVPTKELLELVRGSERPPERKLKVISITGFHGLGKTLLALQTYKDLDVRALFRRHAWVRAEDGDAKEVLRKILEQVDDGASTSTDGQQADSGVHDWSTSNVAKLIERVRSCLCTNRYLIVIDGLRKTKLWDTIESAFPDDDVCSRIIVTTAIQSVANNCSSDSGHVHKMSTLNDEDSKQLFFKVFSKGVYSDADLVESSELLKKCDGLPLALVSTAQFLKGGELKRDRCEEACRKLCAPEEGDTLERMQRVLVNKYTGLSDCLKACLLYFYMFPCDYPTRRNSLLRRWLAEGFVEENLLRFAANNLETLIDRNIIQPMEVSNNGNVKRCKPRGMMLEYISRKSISENFITLLCREVPTPTAESKCVRRLSLHPNSDADFPKDLSRLRTLAVFASKEGEATMVLQDDLCSEKILDDEDIKKFAKSDLLRVLDLEQYDGLRNEHLQRICNLLLLKYLSLGGSISLVPREIAKLKWLQTLDMRRTKIETGVPVQVIQLPQLKHLLGKFRLLIGASGKMEDLMKFFSEKGSSNYLEDLKKFLSEKSNLETLSGFVTGESEEFTQLMSHMGRLRKVKIWCKSTADGGNLTHLPGAIKKFIRDGIQRPHDERSLAIDFKECSERFLDSLEATGCITSLKLTGELRQLPAFVTNCGIQELCLSWTNLPGNETLAGLRNMLTLRYLKLIEENLGPITILPDHFRSLTRICLVGVQSLHGVTIEAGALPFLVSLHMICKDLDGLSGIEITRLGKLKEVALHSQVVPGTANEWRAAASGHPNKPGIVFIDPPKCMDDGDPPLHGRNGTAANETSPVVAIAPPTSVVPSRARLSFLLNGGGNDP